MLNLSTALWYCSKFDGNAYGRSATVWKPVQRSKSNTYRPYCLYERLPFEIRRVAKEPPEGFIDLFTADGGIRVQVVAGSIEICISGASARDRQDVLELHFFA